MSTLDKTSMESLVHGCHGAPYGLLGLHPSPRGAGIVIRTLQLFAEKVEVLDDDHDRALPMKRIHGDGLFELVLPGESAFRYRFRMTGFDGHVWELDDPYRFPLVISDFDLYLHGEGTHYRTFERMGAHPMVLDGVEGVHFAVWAPNAIRVSVVGWFNRWDGRQHPMQNRGSSGLWEIFIPALKPGDLYKFEVKGHHGFLSDKADPYAFASELRPRTASVVWDNRGYAWNDAEWMRQRAQTHWAKRPINVYEVHLGSWRRRPEENDRWLNYRELAEELIAYVAEMGFTHIELLPITEHPFDGSWGYQTIGYFCPTSRFGNPDDLKHFIDRAHQAGLGIILDWVPAHFPKDGHGLGYFDGTHLYEHADPREGEHKDWGTLIFNYGRNEVRSFLLSSAVYWADVFHIDGIRVDAVASMLYRDYSRQDGEWIPNQFGGRENLEAVDFLKRFNDVIHKEFPGFLTFAEESTAWPMVSRPTYLGGLGFDLKWNMGWMHDTLQYISQDPVYRKYHHNNITFSLLYAFSENFILPFSHDEVVHGKRSMLDKVPGDLWQKFANLRLLYAYMYAHPGKKLLFMGAEFGQWREWDCYSSLEWHLLQWESHAGLRRLVGDLNRLSRDLGALHELDDSWEGFQWVDFHDNEQSVVSFIRQGEQPGEKLLCVFNCTPVTREGYRVGCPVGGHYTEILNTDARIYAGKDVGNRGGLRAEAIAWQGMNHSLLLTLPPLGAIYLRPDMA